MNPEKIAWVLLSFQYDCYTPLFTAHAPKMGLEGRDGAFLRPSACSHIESRQGHFLEWSPPVCALAVVGGLLYPRKEEIVDNEISDIYYEISGKFVPEIP